MNDTAFEYVTAACWPLGASGPSLGSAHERCRDNEASSKDVAAAANRLFDGGQSRQSSAGHPGRWPAHGGRSGGHAVMALMTTAASNGHDRDDPGMAGQPVLPRPVAMTGVVQPRGRDGVELRCLECGHKFVAKRRDARYCSRRCAAMLWPSRAGGRTAAGVRRCEEPSCDTVLTGRSDRRFCSDLCRKRAQRRRRADRSAAAEAGRPAPATEREPGRAD